MGPDHDDSSPRPPSIARLEAAVNELEQGLDRFESVHRVAAEELARTKAELTALRALHETVSRRLDETIARLKRILNDQAVEDDLSDDEGGA